MAAIYFDATEMQHLFEGGAYSRAVFNFVSGTHVYLVPSTFTRRFLADAMTDCEEFMFSSAVCGHLVYKPTW